MGKRPPPAGYLPQTTSRISFSIMKPPFSLSNKGLLEVRALSPDEFRPAAKGTLVLFFCGIDQLRSSLERIKKKGLQLLLLILHLWKVPKRDSFLLLVARQGSFLCLPSIPFEWDGLGFSSGFRLLVIDRQSRKDRKG